jgi:hypothetical protein
MKYLPATHQYLIDEAILREFATAAFTYEAESSLWESAYRELSAEYIRTLGILDSRINALPAKPPKQRNFGVGIFTGVDSGGFTVGVGLVWKIF